MGAETSTQLDLDDTSGGPDTAFFYGDFDPRQT